MALSASINTGLMQETQRAAGAIKNELSEQVSLLQQAVALQTRLRESSTGQLGRYIATRQARAAQPQAPAWSLVPSGERSTVNGLPSSVARDQARREFRGMLDDEIKTALRRNRFEGGEGIRQAVSRSRSLLNIAQGRVPSINDLKDVGESAILMRGGKMAASRMQALQVAAQTAFALSTFGMMAVDSFVQAHELGARFGKASGALDLQLKKTFRNMTNREAVDLGARINEMVDAAGGGRVGSSFADRLNRATKSRAQFQNEVLKPILCGDPNKSAVALDMAMGQAANNGLLTRKTPHNLQGRPDAIDYAMRNLIGEQREGVMSHAAEILKDVERQANRQRREFDNDPVMAGEFHDEMRRQRKLEKFEYEDKQRDWGKAL